MCYLPYELGGLKVVNVALKCKALLAKCAVFITDTQYKAKWVYLARYFVGRDLGKLHGLWGFLKSHTKPHAWSAPSYYLNVVSVVRDIKDVFVTFVGQSLAVRVIYTELLIVSRTRIRSMSFWQDKLGRTIPWSKIYAHSYRGIFRQTCSKKFAFWGGRLKLDKSKRHWSIGEAFCRVYRLDRLIFLFL